MPRLCSGPPIGTASRSRGSTPGAGVSLIRLMVTALARDCNFRPMPKPKMERILVAVDFSPCSKAAIEQGMFLSARLGASLDLLHVAAPSEVRGGDDVSVLLKGVPGSTLEIYSEKDIQEKLTAFVKEAGLNRQVRNDEIEEGDPAEVIIQVAKDKAYDLIVIGTHSRKGLQQLIMGSVAQKVAQGASCPV